MSKSKEFEYEYNPIKEQIGGKEAERVIWSTNVFNKALEAITKGLPLKSNPFIGKNTKLLKPDLVYKRTKEELADYIHCKQDPVYFASKCYLMTPEGLRPCVLRDYQIDYLRHLQKNRFSIFLSCRQSGKSTTTAIYCLWVILFNTDKNGLILSKSGPAGQDLLSKIKDMFLYLPYHLKVGTLKWNQSSISFDNNSSISTEAFSPTAGLGKTINFLILDEFAWCPPNDVELFYNNIIPTVTTISDSNVCIMSTQNGFNLFYKLWKAAIEKKNIYAPFKVDWYQVPQFNTVTHKWEKRTDKWKEQMIGILGSKESFYYQYGTQFSASDKCIVSRETLANIRDNTVLFETRPDFDIILQKKDALYWHPDFDLNELKTGWFIILVDLAEGGGGDRDSTVFHIIQLIDKDRFVQVGFWRSNEIELENAGLEFWLLCVQLFNNDRCIISIEWNTYGALFYNILLNLNEPDYDEESSWRWNINNIDMEGFDLMHIIRYKNHQSDTDMLQDTSNRKQSKNIPGIRFNASNKKTACALLKILIERGYLILSDLVTVGELENFEDKNGSGSYKAAFGHDDIIMTCCQIPMLQQTPKYKDFVEEFYIQKITGSVADKFMDNTNDSIYSGYGLSPENIFMQRINNMIYNNPNSKEYNNRQIINRMMHKN